MKIYFSTSMQEITEYDGLHLLQDHIGGPHKAAWNDFDYIVTFNAYFVTSKDKTLIGEIKLLILGCMDTSKVFIKDGLVLKKDKIFEITKILNDDNMVSLPSSIDFYEKLRKILKNDKLKIDEYLKVICDGSFFNIKLENYKTWEGFELTIFRESTSALSILKNGYQIACGRYEPKSEFVLNTGEISNTFEEIQLSFDKKRKLGKTNINLLIGKNGVGKTHILKHFIEIITGLKGNAEKLPCINKLMVMAFSPFEDFLTKQQLKNKIDTKRNSENNSSKSNVIINEYAYVGFRNEENKFDTDWPKEKSARAIYSILKYDEENCWYKDSKLKLLWDTLKLSIDFDAISLNQNNNNALSLTKEGLTLIPDETNIKFSDGITFFKDNKPNKLSSGQIIYSYMLPILVSEITDESLIILDEPELYLHPSLEIGLIEMLRYLLAKTNSFAIIATHSAVMAREMEKKAITILRKENEITKCFPPSFETFGAALDVINTEVFDDWETTKPFQTSIDILLKAKNNDVNEIIKEYSKSLGDDALIYLASKDGKSDEVIELEER